jgi:hypothetical protein
MCHRLITNEEMSAAKLGTAGWATRRLLAVLIVLLLAAGWPYTAALDFLAGQKWSNSVEQIQQMLTTARQKYDLILFTLGR